MKKLSMVLFNLQDMDGVQFRSWPQENNKQIERIVVLQTTAAEFNHFSVSCAIWDWMTSGTTSIIGKIVSLRYNKET